MGSHIWVSIWITCLNIISSIFLLKYLKYQVVANNSVKMFFFLILVTVQLQCSEGDNSAADKAFGYTNFKIKLKSDHGVIDRRNEFQNSHNEIKIIKEKEKVEKVLIDDVLPTPGGPTVFDPIREVEVPMVFILNERFENPKFISRQPKRKKLKKNNVLPITNEIESVAKKKPLKQKLRNFQATGNHANILNTNFRFAYLKRMRQKLLSDENSNDEERIPKKIVGRNGRRSRIRKVKRIRKKIK